MARTYSTIPSAVYYITVSMIVSTTNTSAAYRSTVKPRSFDMRQPGVEHQARAVSLIVAVLLVHRRGDCRLAI